MRHFRLSVLSICGIVLVACSSANLENAPNDSDQAPVTIDGSPETSSEVSAPAEPEVVDSTNTTVVEAEEPRATTAPSTTEAVGPTDAVACGFAVSIVFDEGAPRDRIAISNDSSADISIASARFDLASSVGGIIFDTLDGGIGVEVFQDFQVEGGDAVLANEPIAEDGATDLRLDFESFEPGDSFTFSIDVDDQLTDSDLGQIQVTGAEIAGALVAITTAGGVEVTGVFDQSNGARVQTDC